MQQLEDDDELAYTGDDVSPTDPAQIDGRPSWMKTIHNSALTWLQLLPKSLQVIIFKTLFFVVIRIYWFLFIFRH